MEGLRSWSDNFLALDDKMNRPVLHKAKDIPIWRLLGELVEISSRSTTKDTNSNPVVVYTGSNATVMQENATVYLHVATCVTANYSPVLQASWPAHFQKLQVAQARLTLARASLSLHCLRQST